ncbi:ribonuclease P protein component [Brachyspira hampsonii]|uniref:ribonuclease P protein component n=1 Tax=Brachyspira hampsonii TaxID=1287055 RepID=UPI000D35894E|nr:ribonuclease P protein component [Brachyspira hampsonii]PTY39425.1 ribonuclease P protein component [Brachyspira hampsonii bv. II]
MKLYNKERLKHRGDISAFFNNSRSVKRIYNSKYTVLLLENNRSYSRFAVTIKRNKTNSVGRNRAKRIVREIYRTQKDKIPAGYDYFIIVNRFDNYKLPSFDDYKRDLLKLFQKVLHI